MRGLWATLTIAALLASGCLGDTRPAADKTPSASAPPAKPTFTGVDYRCPGDDAMSDQPCGAMVPLSGALVTSGVAVREEPPLIAVVGTTPVSGFTAVGPAEPTMLLLTSADHGVSWTASPVPTVASNSTRTGQRSPTMASVAFGADGRLDLLLLLNGDVERSIIGGDVPEQLQPHANVAFLSSADDGRTWMAPVLLSDAQDSSYLAGLSVLPDGTVLAAWTGGTGDAHLAWSRDGAAWTFGNPVRGECFQPIQAVPFHGRVLVACVKGLYFGTFQGATMVLSADLAAGTVERLETFVGEPPQNEDDGEGFPACGAAQLLLDGERLLLVLSACPDIHVFSSRNGTGWNETFALDAAAFGMQDGWGSFDLLLTAALVDPAGMLQVAGWAERLSSTGSLLLCTCVEQRPEHAVIDLDTGTVLHSASATGLGEIRQQAGLASSPVPIYAGLGLTKDGGWLAWQEGPVWFGWFQPAPS